MPILITVKNAHELVSKQAGFLGDVGWFFASGALEDKVDHTLADKLVEALKAQGVVADITVVPAVAAKPGPAVAGADAVESDAIMPLTAPPGMSPPVNGGGLDDIDCVCVAVCVPVIAPNHLMPPNLQSGRTSAGGLWEALGGSGDDDGRINNPVGGVRAGRR